MPPPTPVGIAAVVLTVVRFVQSVLYRPHFFLTAAYDDGNYIARADMFAAGSWATYFDRQTFIRGPLYALYLAVVARSGLPLAVVDMLLTAAVCWWLAHELSRFVGVGRTARSLLYLGLLVVPYAETLTGSHVIRDDLAQLVLLATFACVFAALRRGADGWPYAAGAVLGAGATTIIREDAIWMIASLGVLVVVIARRLAIARRWWHAGALVALSLLAYVGPRQVVTMLNERSGLSAPTLFDDDHFVAAHAAIARYINDGTENTRTLTPEMLGSLVDRSPSLAVIAPGFPEWLREGVIYTDAVRFAMDGGLELAGALGDQARRDALLDGIAEEVQALCELDGRPACDGWTPAPPPIPVVRLDDLAAAVRRPLTDWEPLLTVERGPLDSAGDDGSIHVLLQWERIINTSPPDGSYTVEGETVHFGPRPSTFGTALDDASLAIGRVVTPVIRVVGMLAVVILVARRRWAYATLAASVLLAVWVRAAQVALATRFGVGDYDFHYLQPAATAIHVLALAALAGAAHLLRPARTCPVDDESPQ